MDLSKLELVLDEIIKESDPESGLEAEAKLAETREYFQRGLRFFETIRKELAGLDQRKQLGYLLGYLKKAGESQEVTGFLESIGLPEKFLEEKYHRINIARMKEGEEKIRERMIHSGQEYFCFRCEDKIDPKICWVADELRIYCSQDCLEGRKAYLDDYA